MTTTWTGIRAWLLVAAIGNLLGCIGSPLPAGSTAELYRWSDRDNPIAARQGIASSEMGGYFDGDLDFSDLKSDLRDADTRPDTPYLLKSCADSVCYYAVLFPADFTLSDSGIPSGFAALTPLSTAMYHAVSELPEAQVRPRLDNLSSQILSVDIAGDYSNFIKLDYQRSIEHRAQIARFDLDPLAESTILSGGSPSLADLLSGSVEKTSDLQVADSFVFSSAWDLDIDVDVSGRLGKNLYLVICGEFEARADWYSVNYANCQLKTPLSEGKWNRSLRVSAATDELLAIITPLDSPESREALHWVRGRDGDVLRIR